MLDDITVKPCQQFGETTSITRVSVDKISAPQIKNPYIMSQLRMIIKHVVHCLCMLCGPTL